MFDPEKVERFYTRNRKIGFVDAADYDQLLELYRAAAGPNAINAYRIREGLGIDGE